MKNSKQTEDQYLVCFQFKVENTPANELTKGLATGDYDTKVQIGK